MEAESRAAFLYAVGTVVSLTLVIRCGGTSSMPPSPSTGLGAWNTRSPPTTDDMPDSRLISMPALSTALPSRIAADRSLVASRKSMVRAVPSGASYAMHMLNTGGSPSLLSCDARLRRPVAGGVDRERWWNSGARHERCAVGTVAIGL